MRTSTIALWLTCWILTGCSGPFATFPGGALDGPVQAAPPSFAFAKEVGTIQLETQPEDPYSVNLHCQVVGERAYVSAGDTRAQWVEYIEANPHVRMRIEGAVYELAAVRVTDPAELDAFAEAWSQNSWARDPRTLDEVFVYRMEPR